MNIILNITDHILNINEFDKIVNNKKIYRTLTREETRVKIHDEVSRILSNKIARGQLDSTMEHSLFVSTKFGAVAVNIIPRSHFQ